MLTEVARVARSLDAHNIEYHLHHWVKPLARGDRLVIGLDRDGSPSIAELFENERAQHIPQIAKDFQNKFPGSNWEPLWSLDVKQPAVREWLEVPVDDVARRSKALRQALKRAPLRPKVQKKVQDLKRFAAQLDLRFRAADAQFAAFPELLRRAGQIRGDKEWFECLTRMLLDSSERQGPAFLRMSEKLLVGSHDRKKGSLSTKAPVHLFFDVADCSSFTYRVADVALRRFYSEHLSATEEKKGRLAHCAISGQTLVIQDDKTPSPNLPILGPTYLMAMNKEAPCNERYGRTSLKVFPVARQTLAKLCSALVWITDRTKREGVTWQATPGVVEKKRNLLIAYLRDDPSFEAKLAALFPKIEEREENYEELCHRVCDALRKRPEQADEHVELFILNKVSPGEAQVEYSHTLTVAQIVEGAKRWTAVTGYLPPLVLPVLHAPSPGAVLRALQKTWIRGGSEAAKTPGCSAATIYDLLVAGMPGAASSARLVLSLAVRRGQPLLSLAGYAAHLGPQASADKNLEVDSAAAGSLAAVLGLALAVLGERKEVYMQEPAFLLGRLLSLADTLHFEYCQDVRDKDVPPQLLGNATMQAVVQHPARGLAQMQQRLRVYQAWATTKGSPLARWSLREIGKVSATLAQQPLPGRMGDVGKAQLLLGYLARFDSEKNENSEAEEKHGKD